MNRYYEGDIVEILNLKLYENQLLSVGSRYKLLEDSSFEFDLVTVEVESKQCKSHLVSKSQIFLYKRPFKNKILNFIDNFK